MTEVFDAVTLFICTAVTTGVVAVALTYSVFLQGRERATIWWCWAMWCVTLGLTLLGFRTILPSWLAIGAGNALVMLAYGIAFTGYGIFRNVRIWSAIGWAGAAVWLVLYIASETIRNDVDSRIGVASALIAFYSILTAIEAWRGWKDERLPSFLAMLVLFSTHAVLHLGRAGLAYALTADQANMLAASLLAAITLENFIHAIGISFFFFALTKERAEKKYRLAAEVDSLTGAATRRFFVAQTRRQLEKGPKSGVLAVIDLDFFKSVNDCYGHLGGDRVLQAFGKFVGQRLAPGMVFGRLGGEEFGLYLPDVEESEAREFLEKLRIDVEAIRVPFMGIPMRITISVGAASLREAGVDFDHLMAAADGALYLAKEEGRNRLRFFSLALRMHRIVEGGSEIRLGQTSDRLSRTMVRSRVGLASVSKR